MGEEQRKTKTQKEVKILPSDPLNLFGGLKRDDPKLTDFCEARGLVYPEENIPEMTGINNAFRYHPHAPLRSDYQNDRAFLADFKRWSKNNSSALNSFVSIQQSHGDVHQWKFPTSPPLGASGYSDLTKTMFPKTLPKGQDYLDLIEKLNSRGEQYYKKLRDKEKQKNKERKEGNETIKEDKAHDNKDIAENEASTSGTSSTEGKKRDSKSEVLAMISNKGKKDNERTVNPKDYSTAKSLKSLGVNNDHFQALLEMMLEQQRLNPIDLDINLDGVVESSALIDLDEPNPLDVIDNSYQLKNILDLNSQLDTENATKDQQMRDNQLIKSDIERSKQNIPEDKDDSPFLFSSQIPSIPLDKINIDVIPPSTQTPLIISRENTPMSSPRIPKTPPVHSDPLTALKNLLSKEEESTLRDKAEVTKEQIDIDVMILRSGYLNDNLHDMNDDDLRRAILSSIMKMKLMIHKYLVGTTISSDALQDSIRCMSAEVATLSNKLSDKLYSNLVRIPAMRKEIRFNVLTTHFTPFLFVKILSFDSVVITSREINTGLAFSNMAHVSATIQRLLTKMGSLTSTFETVLTQNLALNGLMFSSLADLSKLVQDFSAKMNIAEYAHMKKQVINPEAMKASRLKPKQQSSNAPKTTSQFSQCTYLAKGFMIIPINPTGLIEHALYNKIAETKIKLAKEVYDLLSSSSLIIFDSLVRIQSEDDFKSIMKDILSNFGGRMFTDDSLFSFINERNYSMLPKSKTYNYEDVKKHLPPH